MSWITNLWMPSPADTFRHKGRDHPVAWVPKKSAPAQESILWDSARCPQPAPPPPPPAHPAPPRKQYNPLNPNATNYRNFTSIPHGRCQAVDVDAITHTAVLFPRPPSKRSSRKRSSSRPRNNQSNQEPTCERSSPPRSPTPTDPAPPKPAPPPKSPKTTVSVFSFEPTAEATASPQLWRQPRSPPRSPSPMRSPASNPAKSPASHPDLFGPILHSPPMSSSPEPLSLHPENSDTVKLPSCLPETDIPRLEVCNTDTSPFAKPVGDTASVISSQPDEGSVPVRKGTEGSSLLRKATSRSHTLLPKGSRLLSMDMKLQLEARRRQRTVEQADSLLGLKVEESVPNGWSAFLKQRKQGRFHAVVVGVGEYEDPAIPRASWAPNDARDFADLLRVHDYTVDLLCDDAPHDFLLPTRENVLRLLRYARGAVPPESTVQDELPDAVGPPAPPFVAVFFGRVHSTGAFGLARNTASHYLMFRDSRLDNPMSAPPQRCLDCATAEKMQDAEGRLAIWFVDGWPLCTPQSWTQGVVLVGGRVSQGSHLYCPLSRHDKFRQILGGSSGGILAFYLKDVFSGAAEVRDGRMMLNAVNTFLSKKLYKVGHAVNTTASSLQLGSQPLGQPGMRPEFITKAGLRSMQAERVVTTGWALSTVSPFTICFALRRRFQATAKHARFLWSRRLSKQPQQPQRKRRSDERSPSTSPFVSPALTVPVEAGSPTSSRPTPLMLPRMESDTEFEEVDRVRRRTSGSLTLGSPGVLLSPPIEPEPGDSPFRKRSVRLRSKNAPRIERKKPVPKASQRCPHLVVEAATLANEFQLRLASQPSEWTAQLEEDAAKPMEWWMDATENLLGVPIVSAQLTCGGCLSLEVTVNRADASSVVETLKGCESPRLASHPVLEVMRKVSVSWTGTAYGVRRLHKLARVDGFEGILSIETIERDTEGKERHAAAIRLQAALRGHQVRLAIHTRSSTEADERGNREAIENEWMKSWSKLRHTMYDIMLRETVLIEQRRRTEVEDWESEDRTTFTQRVLRAEAKIGRMDLSITMQEKRERLLLEWSNVWLGILCEYERESTFWWRMAKALDTGLEEMWMRYQIQEGEYQERLQMHNAARMHVSILPLSDEYRPVRPPKPPVRTRRNRVESVIEGVTLSRRVS